MSESVMQPEDERRTCAHVTLCGKDLVVLKGLKVSGRVKMVLTGAIRSKSESSHDIGEEGSHHGSFELDVSSLRVVSNNDIAELFEEDD